MRAHKKRKEKKIKTFRTMVSDRTARAQTSTIFLKKGQHSVNRIQTNNYYYSEPINDYINE